VHHRSQATHAATWELILVDDGLTDETSAYLASVQEAAPVPGTVIADATSRGLPAAINQGVRAARRVLGRAQ
jgi:glycosyltransferase involved in cell wall biosynthesis